MPKNYQSRIEQLVNKMTISYRKEEYIAPKYLGTLPNKDSLVEIVNLLMQILFPGYLGRKNYFYSIINYHVGDLLIEIYEKLSEQIDFAFNYEKNQKDSFEDDELDNKGKKICFEFLDKLPKIREYLATDVQAAFEGDPAITSKDEVIFSNPGIFATSVYRMAHELYNLNVPLIPRILSEYAHNITGIDINAGATIGKYFFIDHGTGVVIGETTIIGNNVKIYQGVTLGALSTRGGQSLRGVKRHPTIEDSVTIYSGVSILGGETIVGQGAVIGSNAFITKSVPTGTKVSVKNPELLFKGEEPKNEKHEFVLDWVI